MHLVKAFTKKDSMIIFNFFRINLVQRVLTLLVIIPAVYLLFWYLPPLFLTGLIIACFVWILLFELPQLGCTSSLLYWLLALFYVAPAVLCALAMNQSYLFRSVLFCFIVLAAINDTMAYCIGNLVGSRLLAPTLSPRKTWEGFLGGLLSVLAGSIFLFMHLNKKIGTVAIKVMGGNVKQVMKPFDTPMVIMAAYFFALLFVLLAVTGDLFESSLKRAVKIKDSGNILPGHGGVLDRIDALLFVIPILYPLCALLLYVGLSPHVSMHNLLFQEFWNFGLFKRMFFS